MSKNLLFSFPRNAGDHVSVQLFQLTDKVGDTNVYEHYFMLDISNGGTTRSFRFPHDIDRLWELVNGSHDEGTDTADLPDRSPQGTGTQPVE